MVDQCLHQRNKSKRRTRTRSITKRR